MDAYYQGIYNFGTEAAKKLDEQVLKELMGNIIKFNSEEPVSIYEVDIARVIAYEMSGMDGKNLNMQQMSDHLATAVVNYLEEKLGGTK